MNGSAAGPLVSVGLVGIALLVGCGGSRTEGPRIAERPDGFAWEPNYYAARRVLPQREVVRQSGYFTPSGSHDSIVLTEYRGAATIAEITAARNEAARRSTYLSHGAPEDREIDGRRAVTWIVTEEYREQIVSREIVAVVPYAERTYTIEFHAESTPYRDPAGMRRAVESFRWVDEEASGVATLVVVGLGLGTLWYVVRRLRLPERRELLGAHRFVETRAGERKEA
jgi:hypothetical protein